MPDESTCIVGFPCGVRQAFVDLAEQFKLFHIAGFCYEILQTVKRQGCAVFTPVDLKGGFIIPAFDHIPAPTI